MRFLLRGVLPIDQLKGEKQKKYATRFKMADGWLFKRIFQGKWLVCIPNKEVKGILQICMRESHQDTLVAKSYGKWLCTSDITGPPCKEMPRILPRSVKKVKGEEMRYIPTTKAST